MNSEKQIYLEIARLPTSIYNDTEVLSRLKEVFKCVIFSQMESGKIDLKNYDEQNTVTEHVKSVRLYNDWFGVPTDSFSRFTTDYIVFDIHDDGEGEVEFMEDSDDINSPACHQWLLPNVAFDDAWDSLIFDSDIKDGLLRYVDSALKFDQRMVDKTFIDYNKAILLHGPPGSGKTTLCKALAQKATIRALNRFDRGYLIEINSHSLFSKWFSESGKLVMKMFEKIHDVAQDCKALIFLVIDEVESLAQCRQSAHAGNEPTDSIRAVNALLTQLDRIKKYPNVFVLTTSNIIGAIDSAFVDRTDMKIFLGPPSSDIIYEIYRPGVNDLITKGIIDNSMLIPPSTRKHQEDVEELTDERRLELSLKEISKHSEGLSGRVLRKIPFLTHVQVGHDDGPYGARMCNMDNFFKLMLQAVTEQKENINNHYGGQAHVVPGN